MPGASNSSTSLALASLPAEVSVFFISFHRPSGITSNISEESIFPSAETNLAVTLPL